MRCDVCGWRVRVQEWRGDTFGASMVVESIEVCGRCNYVRHFSYDVTSARVGKLSFDWRFDDPGEMIARVEFALRAEIKRCRRLWRRGGRYYPHGQEWHAAGARFRETEQTRKKHLALPVPVASIDFPTLPWYACESCEGTGKIDWSEVATGPHATVRDCSDCGGTGDTR